MRRDGRRSSNIDDRRGQQLAGVGGGGLILLRIVPFLMRSKGGRFGQVSGMGSRLGFAGVACLLKDKGLRCLRLLNNLTYLLLAAGFDNGGGIAGGLLGACYHAPDEPPFH